jgi:Fe-S cluster biogenesis protein NfuA
VSVSEIEDLTRRVNEALVDLRSFVRADGGDLELVEITTQGIARVALKGACTTCSMNNMTFKAGVEDAILRAVPEITAVEAVNFILRV